MGNIKLSDSKDHFFKVRSINKEHPLFSGLGAISTSSIKVFNYIQTKGKSSELPLIQLNNGKPLLIESRKYKGKLLVLMSSLTDPYWSNFSYTGWMVVLATRAGQYLAMREDIQKDFTVGQSVILDNLNLPLSSEVELVRPDLGRESVQSGQALSKNLKGLKLDQAGIYRFIQNEKTAGAISVNVDSMESRDNYISAAGEGDLAKGSANVIWIRDKDDLQINRYGRELWKYLIFTIFILIFMEIFIMIKRQSA
jgi:hypothetical protein